MTHLPDDAARPEADPLLEFTVEPAPVEADAPPSANAEVTASPIPGAIASDQPPADLPDESAAETATLRERLNETELALARSREEVVALEAEVATLVAAVEDITERLEQKAATAPPTGPVRSPTRTALASAAAAVLVIATLLWAVQTHPRTGGPTMEPLQAAAAPGELPPPVQEVEPIPAAAADPPPAASEESSNSAPPSAPRPNTVDAPRTPASGNGAKSGGPTRFIGTLAVQSAPGDATVFLNRKPVGTAPVRLSGLRAGSHLVWIEREGYRRWTRVVLVPANQVTRVNAELEALDDR